MFWIQVGINSLPSNPLSTLNVGNEGSGCFSAESLYPIYRPVIWVTNGPRHKYAIYENPLEYFVTLPGTNLLTSRRQNRSNVYTMASSHPECS